MINAHASGMAVAERAAPPVRRIGPRAFALVFALEAALVAAVLALALYALTPQRVPLARSGDYALVREAILARLSGDISDPLVEIVPGLSARESGVRGFALNGQTYYYYLEGQRGFDPLSRGAVGAVGVEVVARDDASPRPLVIYRVLSQ